MTSARPLAVYTALAVAFTWPLTIRLTTLLGAPVGPGDPYLNLWILGWGMHAWTSDPLAAISGRVFDANIFHPAAGTLAYSDHMLLQSGLMAPLYAVTGDVVLCYNVLLLVSIVASAAAMHLFVSRVIGSAGGAYVAGIAWGFGSYRFAHLIHLQLQALYFLPLTFLLLHRLVAGRRRRDAVLLGAVTGLQALASVYYAVIGGVALVVAAIVLVALSGRRGLRQVALRLATAVLVAGMLVAPVGIIYWRVQQDQGFGRTLYEASRNAAFADSYLQAPPGNLVYGRSGLLRQPAGVDAAGLTHSGPERELFPGIALTLLAIAGAWLGWRGDARPVVATMVALVLTGLVLSLGPDGVRTLYATLHQNVFGFQAVRAPARFGVLVTFGLATLAAIAWREWSARARRAPGGRGTFAPLAPVALALVILECAHIPVAFAEAPARRSDIGQWLRTAPGTGAVALLPLGLDTDSTPAMVQSLEHRRPILNGYSGQRPAFYAPLVDALSAFPAPDALLALHESGVQYIVTPAPVQRPEEEDAWPLVPRAQFEEGTIYELVWTPAAEARFNALTTVLPPPVGQVPFRIGEEATYTVTWDGAGVSLAAGTITLEVQPPAYRLVATAETAPWVARFFEARDIFTTTTDLSLLPLVHRRELHEGSRNVTRAFTYDASEGVVRTGDVTLPLAVGARDAIAAIFYVRTQPLAPGDRFAFPVNEAGRNLIVDVAVMGREEVSVGEQQVAAVRVQPQVRQRVQRREQPVATLWISDDARRLPVLVEITAAFGQVRLELSGYNTGD